MNRARGLLGMLTVIICAFAFFISIEVKGQTAATRPEIVTVRPQETDELLANLGMGWYPLSEIEIRNPKHEIRQGTPGGANSKP